MPPSPNRTSACLYLQYGPRSRPAGAALAPQCLPTPAAGTPSAPHQPRQPFLLTGGGKKQRALPNIMLTRPEAKMFCPQSVPLGK